MYSAPAVQYPVGRSRFQLRLIVVVLLLSTVAWLAWIHQAPRFTAAHGLTAVLGWVTAAWALRAAWRAEPGLLRWDGQHWVWEPDAAAVMQGTPRVHLDVQSVLLLEFRAPAQTSRWLWLEHHADALHWAALRRAVFAPRATGEEPQAAALATEPLA